MKLCFIRHAPAFDRDKPGCPPEAERPLTEKGAAKMRKAARGIAAMGIKPEIVFSSPYLRAMQTAEIVCKALDFPLENIRETAALLPFAPPGEFLNEIRSLQADTILCFGHAPHGDALIAACLGCASDVTALKKGGAACVQIRCFSPVECEIEWVQTPKVLRLLGHSK